MIEQQSVDKAIEGAYAAYLKEMKSLGFGGHWINVNNGKIRFYRTGGGTRISFEVPFPEGPITRLDCINHVIEGAFRAGGETEAENIVRMIAEKYDIDLRD